MRFSTILDTFNGQGKNGRQNEITAAYRGVTSNATATELFLDGNASRRLVPDVPAGGILRFLACGYNATDNTTLYAETLVSFQVSAAGVITLVDQDSVTGGAQDQPINAITIAGTRAGVLGNVVTADNGFFVDVVAASGTLGSPNFVPAYLRLQVRGAANKTVLWEVWVSGLEVSGAGA